MPEILTESFCERCGTKYSLEASVPRRPGGVKRAKIVARGLKNYVLSEDAFEESLEAARLEEDKDRAAAQLDAFHKVFNFCMDCRQYTCQGCWNEQESRCLSCAPLPDRWATDPLLIAEQQASADAAAAENGRAALDAAAWPTVDLEPQPEPAWPTADLPAAEPSANVPETPALPAWTQPVASPEVETRPEPASALPAPELVALEQEPDVETPEPEPVSLEPEPLVEPEPVALEPEPEVAFAEPEPPFAAVEPEPVPPVAAAGPGHPVDGRVDREPAFADTWGTPAELFRDAAAAPPEGDEETVALESTVHDERRERSFAEEAAEPSIAEWPEPLPIAGMDAQADAEPVEQLTSAAGQMEPHAVEERDGRTFLDRLLHAVGFARHEETESAEADQPVPAVEEEREPAAQMERVELEVEPVALEPQGVSASQEPAARQTAEQHAAQPETAEERADDEWAAEHARAEQPIAEPVEEIPLWSHLDADAVGAPERVDAEPEPVAAEPEPEPQPVAAEPEPDAVAAQPEAEPEPVALPEPQPERVAAEPEPEPEPVAAQPEPEPVAAQPEPEPVAAKPEPEPVAAEPEPEPVAAEPEPVAPPEPVAATAEPSDPRWDVVAPDSAAPTPSEQPAVERGPEPVWPPRAPVYQPPPPPAPAAPTARPVPPTARPAPPVQPPVPPAALFAAQQARQAASWPATSANVPAAQAVWEESSRGVINRPGSGVQACVSCGLALSASARFCRRCGTRQA